MEMYQSSMDRFAEDDGKKDSAVDAIKEFAK